MRRFPTFVRYFSIRFLHDGLKIFRNRTMGQIVRFFLYLVFLVTNHYPVSYY